VSLKDLRSFHRLSRISMNLASVCHGKGVALRDAGTTGAAGASAPLAFCIFNFVGAVRVQTMGVTGAQNFYYRQH
jgi:hypothetical protein